jgi:hypothetical protein
MIGVTPAEEATPPFGGLEKHSVTAGVRGAIGHAVLHHMNVYPWAKRALNAFLLSPLDDGLHGEISLVRVLAVKQGGGDPNLVCDLYCGLGGR